MSHTLTKKFFSASKILWGLEHPFVSICDHTDQFGELRSAEAEGLCRVEVKSETLFLCREWAIWQPFCGTVPGKEITAFLYPGNVSAS